MALENMFEPIENILALPYCGKCETLLELNMDAKRKSAESALLLIEDLIDRCDDDWPKDLGYSEVHAKRIYHELAKQFGFSTVEF